MSFTLDRDFKASEQSYAKHRLEMGGATTTQPPLNTAGVLWLTDPLRVPFRGRMYEIPPLSYTESVRIMRLQNDLAAMQANVDRAPEDRLQALERWAHGAAVLIRRNVLPEKRRLRWRLRLTRNPFFKANWKELGELLSFLLRSQTTTSVVGARGQGPPPNPSTYSTDSRSTSGHIPRG